jgi:hypothetical protein
VYKHIPAQEGDAHGHCFLNAIVHMERLRSPGGRLERDRPTADLVVDNSNCRLVELAPYVLLAQAYNVEHTIVTISADVEVALQRNLHGVPEEIVREMYKSIQTEVIPHWWNVTAE